MIRTITSHENEDDPMEAIDFGHPDPITDGICNFCGEVNGVGLNVFYTQEQANNYVTNSCNCDDGARYRNVHERQDSYNLMIERIMTKRDADSDIRNYISRESKRTINQLFGNGTEDAGLVRLDDVVLDFLHVASMLIYDGYMSGFTVSVAASTSVKLGFKKGVLSIERQESAKQRLEVV